MGHDAQCRTIPTMKSVIGGDGLERWEGGEKLESVTAPHPSPMACLWWASGVLVWGKGGVNLERARGPETFHGQHSHVGDGHGVSNLAGTRDESHAQPAPE